jgi:hypothetical protein
MGNFPEIHVELAAINDRLEAFAKGIIFESENKDGFTLDNYQASFLEGKKVSGIYFFEILKKDDSLDFSAWMNSFRKKWTLNPVKNRPVVREISVNKLSKHTGNWIPFYIGKSKDIKHRVNQHISLGETTTYALKLKAMKNLDDKTFRLSYIIIDTEHYDMVMPKIEQVLREKYNPIIGKQ